MDKDIRADHFYRKMKIIILTFVVLKVEHVYLIDDLDLYFETVKTSKVALVNAISDIIEEYYIKNSIRFDIILYKFPNIDLIDEIGASNNGKFANRIMIINNERFLVGL